MKRGPKLAEPTAQEIIERAKREARPSTPGERRRIERAGQMLLPGHVELPMQTIAKTQPGEVS